MNRYTIKLIEHDEDTGEERSVEDTLYQVQKKLLNGSNVISTSLLKDIEQHLVDYAVVCRGAERMKELWKDVNSVKTSNLPKE